MLQMSLVSFKRSLDDSLVNSRFLSITFGNIFDGTFVVLHGIVFFVSQSPSDFLKILWDFSRYLFSTFFLITFGISVRLFRIIEDGSRLLYFSRHFFWELVGFLIDSL